MGREPPTVKSNHSSSPTEGKGKEEPSPTPFEPGSRRNLRKACAIIAAIPATIAMVIGLILFWIYGTETHHANRESIWWTERGRNLIPPAATDITLQQDFLDHYATYTISETDLNAFLDGRFTSHGKPVDSFSERRPVDPGKIGTAIGRLGFVVTRGTVEYDYAASNGGVHTYLHDPTTGLTYQSSAYW